MRRACGCIAPIVTTARRPDASPAPPVATQTAETVSFGVGLRNAVQPGPVAVNDLIRFFDGEPADHHRDATWHTAAIGRVLGLPGDANNGIEVASSLQDVGQIGVLVQDVVNRSTGETDSAVHSSAGAAIIDDIDFPWLIGTMLPQHHEHVDGLGFPSGLAQDHILLANRIIHVADAVTTMRELGIGHDVISHLLRSGRGSKLDSAVVDACLAVLPEAPLSDDAVEPHES